MVLVAALLLTGLLADLPIAALAAVVFLIGLGLVDVAGMRRLLAVRPSAFVVALGTAVAVVVLGVQDGIILAIVASIIDHLRHTYHPLNTVLVKSAAGHWDAVPITPGERTEPGLVIYRFGTTLYYANASRLLADITALARPGGPGVRSAGWCSTAWRSAMWTTPQAWSSGRSLKICTTSTFSSRSAACSTRCAGSSTGTASAGRTGPTPITRLPARLSRPTMPPRRSDRVRCRPARRPAAMSR